MRRGLPGQKAQKPRVVRHLDRAPVWGKARAQVEGERPRVIEGAGMDEEAGDRPGEGPADRLAHQEASRSPADAVRRDSEEAQLGLAPRPEVELQEAEIDAAVVEGVGLHPGIVEDLGQGVVGHRDPAEPEPGLPDLPEQGPIARAVLIDALEGPALRMPDPVPGPRICGSWR